MSETKQYKKTTHNQNFDDRVKTNAKLKNGEWYAEELRLVKEEGMPLEDLQEALAGHYGLNDEVRDRLVLKYYRSQTTEGSKPKVMYVDHARKPTPTREVLLMGGHSLAVRMKKGDEREVDCSCDSAFMERIMDEMGQAIRDVYDTLGVSREIPIFLFMDNAGGHGTREAIDAYVALLKEKHNVVCVFQCPRSPATNMLDLGVWMAFQSVVEKLHLSMRQEVRALCNTVDRAWDELDATKLRNVYERWKLVLDLIIKDEGGDRYIEANRGKLFKAPSPEAEELDEEEDEEEEELTAEDIDSNDLDL